MKPTVLLLTFVFALANSNDPTQIEKYGEKVKTYKLEVPGKEPITVIETTAATEPHRWQEIAIDKEDVEVKNLMTHIVHDINENPRCYGPSCQEGFIAEEGPQKEFEDFVLDEDKLKIYPEFSKDRLEAITALAAKLKKDKLKADRYSSMNGDSVDDDSGKVYTSWNRLKVKQHKHPFDDKDGWVSLEPVAWSTSKISKWKPNIKKHKPNLWNDDQDRFPSDDPYNPYQSAAAGSSYNYNYPQKKPTSPRPQFINNKFHVPVEYDTEMPSKPSWTKPMQQGSFTSTWSPDDSRRPHKPNCDSHENNSGDDTVFYGISDSVLTDHRPSNFPHDYEALHQAAVQRPIRRPTQVVYAGSPDYDSDRASRPPHGDGQWVLLSTTKGYRNKKRQRSLNPAAANDRSDSDYSTVTSHQAVSLTVLPADNAHTNMTTSHGGLLEVEKSFQTVEESKRDMDKKHDYVASGSQSRPVYNRVVRRKVLANATPDRTSVLAAVGAGMVPATMAMVVPLMLGRRRRRDLSELTHEDVNLHNLYLRPIVY